MSYLGMGAVFVAIVFLVVNAAVSLAALLVWRAARGRFRRSGTLFALRLLPSAASVLSVAGVALPAYVTFEPRVSGERASTALLALLVVAASVVAVGICRAAGSWLETRRLERSWRDVAGEAGVAGQRVSVIPTALPFAALVGILRPRLYVSGTLLAVLSDDERRAVLAHEAGHGRSRDNLKRAVIRLAPDLLSWTGTGREIERAWAVAVEEAADDHAAAASGRLAVASALLKASRLAPTRLATVSNFCDGGTIARRVERLLEDEPSVASRRSLARWVSLVTLTAATAVAGASLLPLAYAATEAIVRSLQ